MTDPRITKYRGILGYTAPKSFSSTGVAFCVNTHTTVRSMATVIKILISFIYSLNLRCDQTV